MITLAEFVELERLKGSPVEKFVNAMLISAAAKRATHIRATATPGQYSDYAEGSVEFFLDGAWEHQVATPYELHTPIVRRLGVMIGVLPPGRASPRFGRIRLEATATTILYFLVVIDRGDQLSAMVEVVDDVTYETNRQPRPPSPHPYRA